MDIIHLSLFSDHKLCGIQTFKSLQSRSPPDDAGDWEELEVVKLENQPWVAVVLLLPYCLLGLLMSGLELEVEEVEELIEEDADREVPETDIVELNKKDS